MLREFSSRKWSEAVLWESGRQWDGAGSFPGQLSLDHCMTGCLILQLRKGHQRLLWCYCADPNLGKIFSHRYLRCGTPGYHRVRLHWSSWDVWKLHLTLMERPKRSCISQFSQKSPDSSGWTEITNLKIKDNLKSLEKSLHLSSVQGGWGTWTGADICSQKAMKGWSWWIKCWRRVR